ncbi:MAG: N-acetyltransferase family protein [Candidatus Hodarchaeales archaeon]|jgi:ribosomal protein S18 acetylase RimI-like enzyme
MIELDPVDEAIIIRKMTKEDITSIVALDEKISSQHRPNMWKGEVQNYLDKPECICLVAEIQGQVVGFMIGAIHPWLFGVENGGWIEILGVDPTHTAKGVGKMLGEKLFGKFKKRGIKIILTTVEWTSGDLLEFFKTLGMTKSGFITLMKDL